jgi:hypothetical protein
VPHARITAVTSVIKNGAGKVPGLLAVLALVPDPRRPRGRRFPLAFVLAVAAACTPAGAKPQKVLRDLGGLLAAIAIDGKWLRGVLDGPVKLFAAMLHEEKAVIAQHRLPDETTETTQVKALLEDVDLDGAVVTADPSTRKGTPRTTSHGRRCRGRHRFLARQAGRADPPRWLRCQRRADQQGNRARRHQPGRGPGQRRGPRETGPRPVGHRVGALAA